MNTYPEMNAQIVGILRVSDEPCYQYAAQYIEELQTENKEMSMVIDNLNYLLNKSPWVSTKERLPEAAYGCLLIVLDSRYDGGDDFLNYLPYFAGYDGEQWNDGDGQQVPFEVAYWMPLPDIPEEKEEET